MRVLTAVLLILVIAAPALTAERTFVHKGARILAVDVNSPENGDYDAAFKTACSAGMQDVGLSLDWRDIEKSPRKYDTQWPAIANAYYPLRKMPVTLTIRPVHTHRKVVQADLANLPMDDPEMISRFTALLEAVFSKMPNVSISALVVGSEVDVYLSGEKKRWEEYGKFLKAVKAWANSERPDMLVATEATMDGLLTKSKKELVELNKTGDFVGASYYPLNTDFTVKDPKVVKSDLKALVEIYPKKKIRFLQYGYPTSARLKSSEEKQKEFIEETFQAWDKYADKIEMIDFTWLHDLPKSAVDVHSKYYGITDKNFQAFLQTLGLRTYQVAGRDKKAFETLRYEAKARGW